MSFNSFTSNQGTQTPILTDNTGGTAGTVIAVQKVDISPQGTAGTIWNGNVGVTSGTISSDTITGGTLNLATVTGNLGTIGTIGLATVSGNVGVSSGTINVSTISSLPNTPGGTLNLATITGNLGTLGTIGLATVTGNLGTIGTVGLATVSGNVGVSSGTINVSTISTLPNTPGGTINLATVSGNLGTIGTIGLATITGNLGTLGTLGLGTVVGFASSGATLPATAYPFVIAGTTATNGTVYAALVDSSGRFQFVQQIGTVNTGTINVATVSAGTVNTGTVNAGTINVATVTAGTINTGTINTGTINLGTFVGKDANGVVQTGNPIAIAGTNSGGSVITLQVDSSGNLKTTGVANGTTVGTINVGTINTGTINTGTINLGSVVKSTPANSAGSFTAAGSIVVTGSQLDYAAFDINGTWVGTVFTEGQIGTSGWFALPYTTNLGAIGTSFTGNGDYFVSMAGLDGARARLTYSSGTMTYNARQSNFFAPVNYILGGSIGNVGMVNAATISSLPNTPGGTINLATVAGNLGTIGTIGLATVTGNIGTIGTIGLATITGNSPMPSGTLNVGTINVATVTAGTINTGTVNAGTINTGTINIGSVLKSVPASIAGSFTAAGTITQAGSQFDTTSFDIGGTWVGTVFTEGQIGTSAWFALPYVTNLGASGTSFTGNGEYFVDAGGLDGVRARFTFSSGTLTYNSRQSNFESPIISVFGGSIGNIGMLNAGTISSLPNLPQGSINVTAGTVTAGTVNVATVTAGTINTGTFRADARTTQNIITYGTQVAFTGAGASTMVGSTSVGSGTSLWVNDISLFNDKSGNGTFILGFGTAQQGTNVLLRATLGTNTAVGIEKTYSKAVNAGMTNQDLVLSATGAGTVELSFSYFISA